MIAANRPITDLTPTHLFVLPDIADRVSAPSANPSTGKAGAAGTRPLFLQRTTRPRIDNRRGREGASWWSHYQSGWRCKRWNGDESET